jgi:hypothetical protein
MPIESLLNDALREADRFEAFGLIHLNTDQLLFLGTAEQAVPGLRPTLEKFLLHAVTDTESLTEFPDGEEVVYYDVEQRQIVLTAFKTKKSRYLFSAVVSPQKTYKQVFKRLAKSLKTEL